MPRRLSLRPCFQRTVAAEDIMSMSKMYTATVADVQSPVTNGIYCNSYGERTQSPTTRITNCEPTKMRTSATRASFA